MSRPLHVVVSPIIYEDKTLLIKRTKEPYTNFWALVGGKIEIGENIEVAIIREIKEETGLKSSFVAIRGVVYETLYKGKKPHEHFLIWACETQIDSNQAREQNEGEVKWFTNTDLVKHQKRIVPSDFAIIKTFFFGRKQKIKLHASTMRSKKNKYVLEFFG